MKLLADWLVIHDLWVSGKVIHGYFTFRTCFVEAKENGAKKPPMVGGSMCQSLDELCVFCRYPVVLLEPHEYRDSWLDLWSLDVFRSSLSNETRFVCNPKNTTFPPPPRQKKKDVKVFQKKNIIILKRKLLFQSSFKRGHSLVFHGHFDEKKNVTRGQMAARSFGAVEPGGPLCEFWTGANYWIEMRKNPCFF